MSKSFISYRGKWVFFAIAYILNVEFSNCLMQLNTGRNINSGEYLNSKLKFMAFKSVYFSQHEKLKFNNLTLVDIHLDRNLFDYCDLSNYNMDSVRPLLRYHGINDSTVDAPWVNDYFS